MYGIVPLLQILTTLARDRPFPSIVLELKTMLVPAAGLQLLVSRFQWTDSRILERYQIEIFVLSSSGVFLVVVELLTQKHKLSLLESMAVQRFLVKITLTLIGSIFQKDLT